jgi:hypothetical protein
LKILQYEKAFNSVKSRKQVIAKIFVFILTLDENNSKTMKNKKKV